MNRMQAWSGMFGVASAVGLVSPDYSVFRIRPGMNVRYFEYLLKTPAMIEQFAQHSKGIGSGFNRLYGEDFGRIATAVPPPDEQAAIVKYLAHVDRKITRFIRAKRRMIELLNEQKQALIHQAVTKGLNLDVPMKDSGVEWLGEIPANFARTKLGRACRSIRDGTHNPPPAQDGEYRLLSVRNIVNGRFVLRSDDRTMSKASFDELQRSYTVAPGDVVLALVGATTGKSAVVEPMTNVTVQRSIGILRPDNRLILNHYLNLLIRSEVVQGQIRQIMDKYAAQPGIYLDTVSNLQIAFPDLAEQEKRLAWFEQESAQLAKSIDLANKEIELIREYRTRLVSDMVTGKVDVREAAAGLPEIEDEGGDEGNHGGLPLPDDGNREEPDEVEPGEDESW
jgi:type I restriction enzyme S subunit